MLARVVCLSAKVNSANVLCSPRDRNCWLLHGLVDSSCSRNWIWIILAGPLTHYFIYELRNENEYYFYFNMGLNKIMLYASTVILNLIFGG